MANVVAEALRHAMLLRDRKKRCVTDYRREKMHGQDFLSKQKQ